MYTGEGTKMLQKREFKYSMSLQRSHCGRYCSVGGERQEGIRDQGTNWNVSTCCEQEWRGSMRDQVIEGDSDEQR